MTIIHRIIEVTTDAGIGIYDLTPQARAMLQASAIANGQMLAFSRHTTTALAINEYEPRLVEDIKTHFSKLAPPFLPYQHNDLHLRGNIPEDEPRNAHSHLISLMLSTSEIIPIVDGQLGLGTYQSLLLVDLDGPRTRTVSLQITGET